MADQHFCARPDEIGAPEGRGRIATGLVRVADVR